MQEANFKSPYAGWPPTRVSQDATGRVTATVDAQVICPDGLKWMEGMTSATCVLVGACMVYLLFTFTPPGWVWFAGFICLVLFVFPVQSFWRGAFSTRTIFTFTPEAFVVNGGMPYDLRLAHRFSMIPHDLTQMEARKIDHRMRLAQHNREVINPKRYYGDSYHVIFSYDGYTHYLVDIYGKTDALRLLERLKSVDKLMAHRAGTGAGNATTPRDQWGSQPGDLPG